MIIWHWPSLEMITGLNIHKHFSSELSSPLNGQIIVLLQRVNALAVGVLIYARWNFNKVIIYIKSFTY